LRGLGAWRDRRGRIHHAAAEEEQPVPLRAKTLNSYPGKLVTCTLVVTRNVPLCSLQLPQTPRGGGGLWLSPQPKGFASHGEEGAVPLMPGPIDFGSSPFPHGLPLVRADFWRSEARPRHFRLRGRPTTGGRKVIRFHPVDASDSLPFTALGVALPQW